jgi:SWI/SNF-related matrix-associated actin-dependent regulator 1 of chromatin subfamily A
VDTTPPLRGYQRKGVAWLVSSLGQHRAVLLADEMGLGKTVQALHAADRLPFNAHGHPRVLIICPAGARRVWQSEILKWFPDWDMLLNLIEPGSTWKVNPLRAAIVIVSYDELSNRQSRIARELALVGWWDLLILDEAHYLKNPSNRTHAIYGQRGDKEGLQARARRVILLTGTPTPNHAGELYEHCRVFWRHACPGNGSRAAFEDGYTRYKDTVFGRQVTGSKNQAVLRKALKDVILRRRKAAVLAELPPLVVQDMPLVPFAGASTVIDRLAGADQLRRMLQVGDDMAFRLMQKSTALAGLRREIGELKAPAAIEWLRERLESTDKLLVFAWHHRVIEMLRHGLAEFSPVVITGSTSPGNRATAVEAFQNVSKHRVFIGQILAAGTAITLTAAKEVVIVEPSWVPGENVQAIGRAHRMGQHDSVLASFLYLPGTLDEKIMQVFRRKAAEISELTGDLDDTSACNRRA